MCFFSELSRSITNATPHGIAELGIGRTFQNLALFTTMSVLDNVLVGVHSRTRSDFASNALRLPWVGREEREARQVAREVIASHKAQYLERFGAVPEFRAALHQARLPGRERAP